MAKPTRKRPISPNARRVLELVAGSPDGVTEEMLVYGHGFSRQLLALAGLVRNGLVTARRRVIMAADTPVEVGKVMITAAGRRAIKE